MYIGLGTILLLIAGAFLMGYGYRKRHQTEDTMIAKGDERQRQMKKLRERRSSFWEGL